MIQKRHLNTTNTHIDANSLRLVLACRRRASGVKTHQDDWNVLRLHDEELVIANHGLKELQCDGGVLVLAYATREELHTHTQI